MSIYFIIKLCLATTSLLNVLFSANILYKLLTKYRISSIFLQYTLFINLFFLISVFEPQVEEGMFNYTEVFFFYELVTSLLFCWGVIFGRKFYYPSTRLKKIKFKSGYLLFFVVQFFCLFVVCFDNSTSFFLNLIIPSFVLFLVLFPRLVCIFKPIHFLLLIFLAFFVNVIQNNMLDNLLQFYSTSIMSSDANSMASVMRSSYLDNDYEQKPLFLIYLNSFVFYFFPFLPSFFLEKIYNKQTSLDRKKNTSIFDLILFFLLFLIGSIICLSTLGNARIVYYILGLLSLFLYLTIIRSSTIKPINFRSFLFPAYRYSIKEISRLNKKRLKSVFVFIFLHLLVLVLGIALVGIMYYLTGRADQVDLFFEKFLDRFFVIPIDASRAYFILGESKDSLFIQPSLIIKLFLDFIPFKIILTDTRPEGIVSSYFYGSFFGLVAPGFAVTYLQLKSLSILVSLFFILAILNVDRMLLIQNFSISSNKASLSSNLCYFSPYSFLFFMIPITVTVTYSSGLGLFGLLSVPNLYILLRLLDNDRVKHVTMHYSNSNG